MNSSLLIGLVLIMTGFILLCINISSLKEKKERLHKSENFYNSLPQEQYNIFNAIHQAQLSLIKKEIIFSLFVSIFGLIVIIFF